LKFVIEINWEVVNITLKLYGSNSRRLHTQKKKSTHNKRETHEGERYKGHKSIIKHRKRKLSSIRHTISKKKLGI